MILKMELRSDAIPGSGEGLAGIIDVDIPHDEFGLPYIPAKRVKGILRESARDLEDVNTVKKVLQHSTREIFGKRGEKDGTALKISDGHIEQYVEIRRLLQACSSNKELTPVFNREAVLAYYTYTRSQTTIHDPGTANEGTAKEGSLRTFRVLKGKDNDQSMAFYFELKCPDAWKEDLTTICQVTRNFGNSRTRGLGEISLSLHDAPVASTGQKSQAATFQEDQLCCLQLDIENQGQLFVNVQVGKEQTTEPYIPGSFIAGAFAQVLKKSLSDNEFRKIFLDGDVIFSNAYPVHDSSLKDFYYPAPVSIVKEKDKENYLDLAFKTEETFCQLQKEKIQTKGRVGDFTYIRRADFKSISPSTEVEYHHARPQDRSLAHPTERNGTKEGDFFQFTVLQPHQTFRAEITGKYSYLKPLQALLHNSGIFYLGRSKTAQYGKCTLQGTLTQLAATTKTPWKNGDTVVFTLASEMILCNEHRFITPDPHIFRNEVAEMLDVQEETDLKIEHTFLQFKQIGGFLSVWQMPRIQQQALAAGSVIVCRNNTGKDLDASILEQHSFGLRTQEGFGKILINWHGKYKLNPPTSPTSHYPLPDNLNVASDLIHFILKNRLQETVKAEASIKFNAFKNSHENITNTFIGKMLLVLNAAKDFKDLRKRLVFKDRARKKLEKIKDYLYLEMDGNEFQVKEADFRTFLEQKKDSAQSSRIGDIVKRAEVEQDFTHTDMRQEVFKYYQIYAIHFFNLLKFHNREEKNRDSKTK
jgi:CRISPR-associated protein Csx10